MEVGNHVDVLEQIMIRLDIEDIIQCKSVCKSWYNLISSNSFVKFHLKRSYNNDKKDYNLRDRRIAWPTTKHVDRDYLMNDFYIIGSCNGLVCISPKNTQLIVTNPLTRELKRLTTFPLCKRLCRDRFCWGFGYDSSLDDYKVVLGFVMNNDTEVTLFFVLTLKSYSWKYVGQVKYQNTGSKTGALFEGALYWFMSNKKETVIISLDLSRDEIKEISQPDDPIYLNERGKYHKLVTIRGCLCIHYDPWIQGTYRNQGYSYKTWVMNENKSWQVLQCDDDTEMKYDIVHFLKMQGDAIKNYHGLLGVYLTNTFEYLHAPVFVQSLVSPRVNNNNNNILTNNVNERLVKTKNNGRQGHEKINNNKGAKRKRQLTQRNATKGPNCLAVRK